MKLYLAYKDCNTLMEGLYESCLGVFDSEKKAWEFLKTTGDFEHSESSKRSKGRVYHFDGEMSYYWHVLEVELNKPIYEAKED